MFAKQINAFEKFKKLKVGALFMQMGTGKTKVAIDLVNYNKVDLLIYVCPFSTKATIEIELEKWKPNCKYILVAYETISSSDSKYLDLLGKIKGNCFIIADESIFIKNETSKRFNRVCTLRDKCRYALILNGTPLTKNEWDLYNQMYFLSPLILKMNREEFLNVFFKKITYKKNGRKEKSFYKFSEVNAKNLHQLIEPYIFACELSLKLDEKENRTYIPGDNCAYNEEKEKSLEEMQWEFIPGSIIGMLNRLNYIAAISIEKNKHIAQLVKGKQIIVYCNYLDELHMIASKCECYIITGETKNRSAIINDFRESSKPLLLTLGVGSYGLNLQFCNHIVYSSLSFDYGKMKQSKYRIKRIGQERNIMYDYILSDFGINQMILENLIKKKNLHYLIKEKIEKGEIKEWLKNI